MRLAFGSCTDIGPLSVDVAPAVTVIVPVNCPAHVGRVGMPPGPIEIV